MGKTAPSLAGLRNLLECQLVAQLDVVVDLAVVDQRQPTALVVHGHVAGWAQVEDAQALRSECAAAVGFQSAVVGAAVALHSGHVFERGQVAGWDFGLVEAENAGDAAHLVAQSSSTSERASSKGVPRGTIMRSVRRLSGTMARVV